MLEELELDYELVTYARDPETKLAPNSLRSIHPLGKSPVITDGELTLAESGAILEYLAHERGDGSLVPASGSPERTRYTYWMHYAEGSAAPPLLLKLVFDMMPTRVPIFARPLVSAISKRVVREYVGPQLRLHLDFLEGELTSREYFAGDAFTAADVQMTFPLQAARARGVLTDAYPKLRAFLERMSERPAYKRAAERGGPHDIGEI